MPTPPPWCSDTQVAPPATFNIAFNSGQSLTSAQMSNTSPCVATSDFTGTPPTGSPRGQATSRALLGKMLRIDVDSTDTPAGADLCGADTAVRHLVGERFKDLTPLLGRLAQALDGSRDFH